MPQFEATLSDGRVVTVESDHEPTEQEILSAVSQYKPAPAEEPPGAVSTFARSAATGVAPGAAAAAAFGPSAALGAPLAPETYGLAPLVTGAVGSALAGGAVAFGQQKLLEKYAPGFLEKLATGEKAHPVAGAAGRVASALPSFEFAPGQAIRGVAAIPKIVRGTAEEAEKKAATALAAQLGAQAGITTAQTAVLEKRVPTPQELLESAAVAATFGHPRFSFPTPAILQKGAQAYARSQQEAAAVHGPVRPQPGEGAGQVPVQEGGARVQPRAQEVAQGAQVSLDPNIPNFTGSDAAGWTLHFQGVSEPGFKTRLDAEQAATAVMAGTRQMQGSPSIRTGQSEPVKQPTPPTPEERDLVAEMEELALREGENTGTPVTPVDKFSDEDPTVPFSRFFMRATGTGAELHRENFMRWVIDDLAARGLPKEKIRQAVVARVNEEAVHNQVSKHLSDEQLAGYWNDLTALEKWIERRIYWGHGEPDPRENPTMMAHEAIRRRIQQSMGLTPGEFAETIGREHVTIRTLDVLGRIVRGAREALGTKASARQRELFERALSNIELAKMTLTGRERPSSVRRGRDESEEEFYTKLVDRLTKQVDLADLRKDDEGARIWGERRAEAQRKLDEVRKRKYPFAARRGRPGEPEEITAAAYIHQGRVEQGANHPEILDRLGVKGYESAESRNTPDFGFVTTRRPFITREEAGPVATASGQNLKRFEPGEPVHSDEVESPVKPGTPISEMPGAARRREPEDYRLPDDLAKAIYNAQLTPETKNRPIENIVHMLAVTHVNDWPKMSEHHKDQMLAWFNSQRGGPFDRLNLIDTELSYWNRRMKQFESSGALAPASYITRETYLRMLRSDIVANMKAPPESYSPAAARRERQPFEGPYDADYAAEQEIRERGVLVNGKYYPAWPGGAEDAQRDIVDYGPESIMAYAASDIVYHGYNNALEIATDRADDQRTQWSRKVLEAVRSLRGATVRIGPVLPPPEWKSQTQLRFPFAARRKPEPGQTEMFGGVPLSAPKLIKATDPEARKLPEGMTLPAYNANQIAEAAQRVFESAKPFRVFYQWMQRNVGKVPTGPAFNVWLDTVTNNLQHASGVVLKGLVEKLGVQHRVYPFRIVATKALEKTATEFPKLAKGAAPLEGKIYTAIDIPDRQEIPLDPRQLPASLIAEIRQKVADRYRKENLIVDERRLAKEQDDAVEQVRFDMVSSIPMDKRKELIDRREAIISGQKTRAKAISAIFQKLIEQGAPDSTELGRKEIAIDDLDWSNPNAEEGVWRDIRGDEAKNIDKLNEIFKDEARRNSFDNVSHTKRVAVMLNRRDGKVAIVSAYPHGRSGTMVMDPSGATGVKGKPNVPLASVLNQWRPIASMLLKEPIKDFYKPFDDIEKFNEYIGKDAQETERSFTYESPLGEPTGEHWRNVPEWLQSDYETGMEGGYWEDNPEFITEAYEAGVREQQALTQEGETTFRYGTMVTEPGRGVEYEAGRSALMKKAPLSSREAMEVMNYVLDRSYTGKLSSKEEMAGLLSELTLKAETGKIKPRDWLVISALRKAANEVYVRENKRVRELRAMLSLARKPIDLPYISRDQAYKLALDRYYDLIQNTPDRASYLAGAMEYLSRPTPEVKRGPFAQRPLPPSPGQTGPVLQEPTEATYGPEFVGPRPTGLVTGAEAAGRPQFGTEPRIAELTTPERPPIEEAPLPEDLGRRTEPSAALPPDQVRAIEERAKTLFPYEPTTGEAKEFKTPSGRGRVTRYTTRPEFLLKRATARGGYELGPERRQVLPGAAIRGVENVKEFWEEFKERGIKYIAPLTRANTVHDINASRDGVDRQVETYGNMAANDIRLASVKLEAKPHKPTLKERLRGGVTQTPQAIRVRQAAKAYIAALQVAEDEEWARLASEWARLRAEIRPAQEEAQRRHKTVPSIPKDQEPKLTLPTAPSEHHFDRLIRRTDAAIKNATEWSKSPFPGRRIAGRRWLKAARELRAEVEYAKAHLGDTELRATVDMYRNIMQEHLNNMNEAGLKMEGRDYYVPGLYDGEIWNNHSITWGDMRILGTNYRMPKSFRNYYEAIEQGPYIPVSRDIADLAQHSLIAGARVMSNGVWLNGLKSFEDQLTGKPIAIEPSRGPIKPVEMSQSAFDEMVNDIRVNMRPGQKIGQEDINKVLEAIGMVGKSAGWQVPAGKPEYELVYANQRSKPMAILKGYDKIVSAAMAKSVIRDLPVLSQALMASQMLKHGLILIIDTFHPGRLAQYGAALAGKNLWDIQKPGFHSGLHALMYNPKSLDHAVAIGAVSKKSADWAREPIQIYDKNVVRTMSRQQLLLYGLRNGLNATQTADTIYRNSMQKFPLIGEYWNQAMSPLNKWIFDRITPGLISESFVKNMERLNQKNRGLSLQTQVREVVRDMNVFYGNLGRNGIFKNPNMRDLAQIFLLAPLWQEGLIAKELRTLSRVTGVSYAMGRRGLGADVYLGPLTRGVVRGLAAYFVLSQVVNLVSRGKWTFENEEPDHKLDAWLPVGGEEGVWLSPMSVFAELMHDLIRLGQSKPKIWDGITQVGNNKLGPIGRMAMILHEGRMPTGEEISTTAGVLRRAAGEMAPAPISLGTPIRAVAHAIAPQAVAPPRPGQVMQRGLGAIGIKTQLPTRTETDVRRLAAKFVDRNGLRYEPLKFTPTDEASYAKLRAAIRNDDLGGASTILSELRKHRTDAQILKSMREASARPFTGSRANEQMFLYSLSNKELDLYYKANLERAENYQKFLGWFTSQPQ